MTKLSATFLTFTHVWYTTAFGPALNHIYFWANWQVSTQFTYTMGIESIFTLRRVSLRRYLSYLTIALLASLSYNYLVVNGKWNLLATLFPIAAAGIAIHITQDSYPLPVSYCFAVSITTYLLGYVANGMHLHISSPGKEHATVWPAPLHFLLAFIVLSDLEWCRLRFDQNMPKTMYPDILGVTPFPRYVAFVYEQPQLKRHFRFLNTLNPGWRYILMDFTSFLPMFLAHAQLHHYIVRAIVYDCAEHAGLTLPRFYQFEYWRASCFWPIVLEIILVRPIRLFSALVVAWLGDLLHLYAYKWTGPVDLPFHR
ncbi:hypothetical protein FB567DRAFT_619259 [Paraphoma chrysanthemicola]|uniref:Uncharacterized protein n=1 Tax=Paraphoma chrysanthemicola TaxID=798071 RepID=A0A8K0W058_9PLEO|nr:hypothetical protein FB567DRAFT_619259 [Paraphoma chrysanthemicola]